MKFILHEVLKIQDDLLKREQYKDFEVDDINMIIDEAAKFAETILAPINKEGDKAGCTFDGTHVKVPEPFHKAYKMMCENGWSSTSVSVEHGGQGLPGPVCSTASEMFAGANTSFLTYPGLTVGIGRLIQSFGSDWLKEHIMPKLYSGEWGGTMMLTEPNAGTDVGALTASAKKDGDNYLVSGTKMFITGGDHDLVPNIIHTILVRVKGAPPGVKGVSLVVVPKIWINEDGSLGEPNDVACGGIEEKIGMHGSSTCLMNMGENEACRGWILGEENMGLPYMFQMMNEARIGTGLQGAALGGAAYGNALTYAKERIQGVAIENSRKPDAPKVEIIKHPDVRRMLLTQKAYVEGMRIMLYYCSYHLDMAETADNPDEHDKHMDIVELLTPICKAYCTDIGFKCCELAIQTMGGYGATQEYPVEQHLRDVKIGSIYEGTNGIQALDLVGRKLGMKKGKLFMNFLGILGEFEATHKDHQLKDLVSKLSAAKNQLVEVAMKFGEMGKSGNYLAPIVSATPFLQFFGNVLMSYLLLWEAVVAQEKLDAIGDSDPDRPFYRGKIQAAKFFLNNILPENSGIMEGIMNEDRSVVEIAEDEF